METIIAQVPGFGACPKVKVVEDFKLDYYLGEWFEIKKYPFIFTLGGKCVTADYGLHPNGSVSVFNKMHKNGREESELGLARLIHPGYGLLGVSFPASIACQLIFRFIFNLKLIFL